MGPLKKSLRSGPKGPLGPLGPLKSRFAPGPKGLFGPLGPLKSRFAPGSMLGIPQNGRLHLLFHAWESKKWAASPSILEGFGHEIKSVADHFGGFRAWIPERSDSFKGPKPPRALWAWSEATFLRGPRAPRAPHDLSCCQGGVIESTMSSSQTEISCVDIIAKDGIVQGLT